MLQEFGRYEAMHRRGHPRRIVIKRRILGSGLRKLDHRGKQYRGTHQRIGRGQRRRQIVAKACGDVAAQQPRNRQTGRGRPQQRPGHGTANKA